MSPPLGFDEALARWLAQAPGPETQRVTLREASGRVLAEGLRARDALPPFDNAAMDGFALRMATDSLPAGSAIALSGAQFAGDGLIAHAADAVEITTGALLPEGYDAVVPVERTVQEGNTLRLTEPVQRGQHIRRRGQDVEAGADVLAPGRWIDAEVLTMLASLGLPDVAVARRPRLAVIATGRELVDDPGQPLQPGQIRNGNRPGLVARIAAAGAECVFDTTIGAPPSEVRRMSRCSGISAKRGTPSFSASALTPPCPKICSSCPQFEQICVDMFSIMPSTGTCN